MNDDNKALKKSTFYKWVEEKFTPLDKKVASIRGTLWILIPLTMATLLAIISLAVIVANWG